MALAGFLTTAQTITGTHTDFPALLVAANFTNADANALDGTTFSNGGGNVIVYTDQTKTTRVPIEVVEFVTGGTPSVQIWAKHPSMQTGATFWVEADDTQVSQPAVTDTYGRNAVYTSAVSAYVQSNGTDSSGNFDLTVSGGGSISATSTDSGIDGISFDGNVSLVNSSWTKLIYPIYVTFWGRRDPSSATQCVFSQGDPSSAEWDSLLIRNGSNYEINIDGTSQGSTTAIPDNVWDYTCVKLNTDDNEITIDGVVRATDLSVTQPAGGMTSFALGELVRTGSSLYYEGDLAAVILYDSDKGADWCNSSYSNQNSPSAFWTSSDWTAGGGITVSAETQDYNINFFDASIDLTGEILINAGNQDFDVAFYDAAVDLTGEVLVNAESQSYSITFYDAQVSLVSGIEVQAQTQDYNVTFYDAQVSLFGQIDVTAEAQQFNVQFFDAFIDISELWKDKAPAVTAWTDATKASTIWTDK